MHESRADTQPVDMFDNEKPAINTDNTNNNPQSNTDEKSASEYMVKVGLPIKTNWSVAERALPIHFPEEMGPDLQKGVWLPVQPTGEMLKDRGYHFFNVVGALRPGASAVQPQHELDAIAAHIPQTAGGDGAAVSESQ